MERNIKYMKTLYRVL